jgi:hypothetical protein
LTATRSTALGTLVSSFGSSQLSGSSGQGGSAVDGASGEIYVSDPGAGKVDVFGSDAPAVTVGSPTNVTKETATLSGTVDPRGTTVTSCEFEYGVADEFGRGSYEHTVLCSQTPSGTIPVPVSANISGLRAGLLYRFRLKVGNVSGFSESSGLLATLGEGSKLGTVISSPLLLEPTEPALVNRARAMPVRGR